MPVAIPLLAAAFVVASDHVAPRRVKDAISLLAASKVEELGPLQGAVNFAITNTAGAYLILMGIGLLYARTGALNFAQLGHFLATHPSDRLVVVALTLVFIGFLIKAAIVPFHW